MSVDKIASVKTIAVSIPHDHGGAPAGFGGRNWPSLSILLVRLETTQGQVGWGEAFSYNCLPAVKAVVDETIAPLVVGRDAGDIEGASFALQQALHLFGRYGITMFGISGVDIALWDLAGKAAGLPVHRLLGGPMQVPALKGYASLFKYGDPAAVGERVRDAMGEGYVAIKLHETGVEEALAARAALGDDVPLCMDTNCPWTPLEARTMTDALRDADLYWLEEPVFPPEDFRALAHVRAMGGIPIAAGENACTAFQFRHMFDEQAVDFAQPSVTKVGGITEFRKVTALAETSDVQVVPHCPYFGPGWLASLHLMAASPRPQWIERFYTNLEATLYPGFVSLDENGNFPVPSVPGLGPEPDLGVIKEYEIK